MSLPNEPSAGSLGRCASTLLQCHSHTRWDDHRDPQYRQPRVRPFNERTIRLVETFADQAAIAIENARLFSELEQRNAELQESNRQVTEALEQQTATAEILRAVASSPTDLEQVLDTIVASAARLCGASGGGIWIVDGDQMTPPARFGTFGSPENLRVLPRDARVKIVARPRPAAPFRTAQRRQH